MNKVRGLWLVARGLKGLERWGNASRWNFSLALSAKA
jgi:hypothetical protein